jgi:hypothetical protein
MRTNMFTRSTSKSLLTSLPLATRCALDADGCAFEKTQITETAVADDLQPWPIVEKFLLEQADGAIGVDVGCGNGKYLAVNPRIFMLGSDRYVLPLDYEGV